ncbi:hypothetical protein HanIR_Chr06g0290541 [Helianthus annuus]|nr:hypothetical protein HanIR_Chr06g0290541 [Helianthus annuus]
MSPRGPLCWAWGWARYTQIDLPLLSLGPTLRINGLKFPPTHSHDLSSKPSLS